MDRRSFIRSAGIGMVLLSGCSGDSDSSTTESTTTSSRTTEPTTTESTTPESKATETTTEQTSEESESTTTESEDYLSIEWEYSELSDERKLVDGTWIENDSVEVLSTSDTIYILQPNGYLYNIDKNSGKYRWFKTVDLEHLKRFTHLEMFEVNNHLLIVYNPFAYGSAGVINADLYTSGGKHQYRILPRDDLKYQVGDSTREIMPGGNSNKAIFDGETLYIAIKIGENIYALDFDPMNPRKNQTITDEWYKWPTFGPYTKVPEGNGLIMGTEGDLPDYLTHINSTGQVGWQIELEGNVTTSNIHIADSDDIVVVGNKLTNTNGAETIVSTLNGDIKWQHTLRSPTESYGFLGDPATTEEFIFVPYTESGSLIVKKFRKDGNGEEVDSRKWTQNREIKIQFQDKNRMILGMEPANSSKGRGFFIEAYTLPDLEKDGEQFIDDLYNQYVWQLPSSELLSYSERDQVIQYMTVT